MIFTMYDFCDKKREKKPIGKEIFSQNNLFPKRKYFPGQLDNTKSQLTVRVIPDKFRIPSLFEVFFLFRLRSSNKQTLIIFKLNFFTFLLHCLSLQLVPSSRLFRLRLRLHCKRVRLLPPHSVNQK